MSVTACMMDCVTSKSGHQMVPLAVSVCTTPAAPSPIPVPYPVTSQSMAGIKNAPVRTKIEGAKILTVGASFKSCVGNQPGTMKEVVSVNTGGPSFIVMGAPVVFVELGMQGITGSPGFLNKGGG